MPSDGGRRLRRLAFAQAAGAPGGQVGLCAAAIRPLGAAWPRRILRESR
jgi:hypothetical protein